MATPHTVGNNVLPAIEKELNQQGVKLLARWITPGNRLVYSIDRETKTLTLYSAVGHYQDRK